MAERHFAQSTFIFFGGFIVWALHFTLLYGFNALACARGFARFEVAGANVVLAVSIASTAAALVAIAGLVIWALVVLGPPRDRTASSRFLRFVAIAGAALSAVAVVFNMMPAAMLQPCG